MHLRRAVLLFALVLGLTALAASIAPAPRRDAGQTVPPSTAVQRQPVEEAALTFHVRRRGAHLPVRRVAPGSHLSVAVSAAETGQAEIPRLGLTATVTPSAPARFDLIAPQVGRSDVVFTPTTGEARPVGTLVSRRPR